MYNENAKQVAKRDALYDAFVKDLPPGMQVEYYSTIFESGMLYVQAVANFVRFATRETEHKLTVKIGPRGGVKPWGSHQ